MGLIQETGIGVLARKRRCSRRSLGGAAGLPYIARLRHTRERAIREYVSLRITAWLPIELSTAQPRSNKDVTTMPSPNQDDELSSPPMSASRTRIVVLDMQSPHDRVQDVIGRNESLQRPCLIHSSLDRPVVPLTVWLYSRVLRNRGPAHFLWKRLSVHTPKPCKESANSTGCSFAAERTPPTPVARTRLSCHSRAAPAFNLESSLMPAPAPAPVLPE